MIMCKYNIEYSSYKGYPTLLSYTGDEKDICTIRQLDYSGKVCPIGIHILNETGAMYTWKLIYNPTIIFNNEVENICNNQLANSKCEVITSQHTMELNDNSIILASGISRKTEFTKDISNIFYEEHLIDSNYLSLTISYNKGAVRAYGSIIWRESNN